MMQDTQRFPIWTCLLCFLLLLATCAMMFMEQYGQARFYDADTLMDEDMYRDLVEQKGAWALWGQSNAPHYIEIALYFIIRWLTGSVHNAMPLHSVLLTTIFLLSSVYLIWPALQSRAVKFSVLLTAFFILPLHQNGIASHYISYIHGHSLVMSASIFSMGLFFRLDLEKNLRYNILVPLSILITLCVASDLLFVLSFCIPTFVFVIGSMYLKHIPLRNGLIFLLALATAYCGGEVLDATLRNFPSKIQTSFGFTLTLKSLLQLFQDSYAVFTASPTAMILFGGGFVGFMLALFQGGMARKIALYCILAAILNLMLVALSGKAGSGHIGLRLVLVWLALPSAVGIMFTTARIARYGKAFAIPALTVLALILLAHTLWSANNAYNTMLPAYYPPQIQELDKIAREKGLKTGIANYWLARPMNILSKEGVHLIPLKPYGNFGFLLQVHTRAILRDKVDMIIDYNRRIDQYHQLDRPLVLRANGEPDEIVPMQNGNEILIYNNGAYFPSEGEIIFEGAHLVPDMAKGDRLHWQGELILDNGLTLTEVRSAPRTGVHWLVLSFKEDIETIQGKSFTVKAAGNKLTRHRRSVAAWISPEANSLLDSLYLLFVSSRPMLINMDNSTSRPGGTSAAWGKLPNWNSTEWLHIFLDDGEKIHRIK